MVVSIVKYMKLLDEHPEYFKQYKQSKLILDMGQLIRTNKNVGVVYEGPKYQVVVDLVKDRLGNMFESERVVPVDDKQCFMLVAVYNNMFILLKQFRHSLRKYQYLFPRGTYRTKSDICEKFGVSFGSLQYLGKLVADSSISNIETVVYACTIDSFMLDGFSSEASGAFVVTRQDFEKLIMQGKLTDASTIAAYTLWLNRTQGSNDGLSDDSTDGASNGIIEEPGSRIDDTLEGALEDTSARVSKDLFANLPNDADIISDSSVRITSKTTQLSKRSPKSGTRLL